MHSSLCFLIILALCASPTLLLAGGAPRQIAGIVMGSEIDQYKGILEMNSALPLRDAEYLTEVEMKPMEGYQRGSVVFGDCENPGQIVKVKLRYARDDREFFDELLKRFNDRFGGSAEYKGDPFRVFLSWKWSFTDEKGNRVSLILQHNSMDDDDYPSGNTVKISLTSQIEKEHACYDRKHPGKKGAQRAVSQKKGKEQIDFRNLVPE